MSDTSAIHAELAELCRKQVNLESPRDVLSPEAFEVTRAGLEARVRALVEIGGGALIVGNVAVERGDLVGRDKW